MSFNHTLTPVYKSSAGQVSLPLSQTSGAETNVQESIAAEASDLVVDWAQDITQIKSLFINSDLALTIKTFLATVEKDTITLVANEPLVWQTSWYYTLANAGFTSDFDEIKVSNVSTTTAANLDIRCLYDPTV
jgi:hypothetical protein